MMPETRAIFCGGFGCWRSEKIKMDEIEHRGEYILNYISAVIGDGQFIDYTKTYILGIDMHGNIFCKLWADREKPDYILARITGGDLRKGLTAKQWFKIRKMSVLHYQLHKNKWQYFKGKLKIENPTKS